MAQLLLEPFAGYALTDMNQIFNTVSEGYNGGSSDSFSTSSPPRVGAQYLQMRISGGAGIKQSRFYQIVPQYPIVSGNTAIFGFRVRSSNFGLLFAGTSLGPGQTNGGNTLFGLWKSGGLQVWGRFALDGTIQILRSDQNNVLVTYTSTVALAVNTWVYVEFKIVVRTGTNGSAEVRLNGLPAPILSVTGINTAQTGVDGWNAFTLPNLGANGGNNTSVGFDIVDLYLADGSGATWNDYMGELRVDLRLPTAAGSNNMSTPSTGTDRSLTVDDPTMNGDTDFNTFSAVNDKDTYAMQDAPVAGSTILGIETRTQMRKVAAGTATVKHVVRVNGVDYLGVENGVPSSYGVIRQPWSVNPATGVAWVDTGVNGWNATEAGVLKSA